MLLNWKPIRLLNVDYKILSKIMTNRLSRYMQKLVSPEQKCAVKGKHITDIIRNTDNYRQRGTGCLVLLDQTKAFDKVNHDYLFTTLEHLGIIGDFLEMIKLNYNNITSQIMINGKLTDNIRPERRVRQGCPLNISRSSCQASSSSS